MSDPQFDAYRKLLALAKQHPTTSALRKAMAEQGMGFDQNEPISGYFRHAETKGGPLAPLAIFRDPDGTLNVWWGDVKLRGEEIRVDRFWPYCAWKPVSFEDYCAKLDGKEWPDIHVLADEPPLDGVEELAGRIEQKAEDGCCEEASLASHSFYIPCNKPAMHMVGWPARSEGPYRMCADCARHNVKNRSATIVGPYEGAPPVAVGRLPEGVFPWTEPRQTDAPGPGHNSGASVDEVMALAEQISEARAGVKQYATITSDEQRAQSQTLRSDLLKLSGEAKKKRNELLRPHKEAVEKINEAWKPLEDSAQAGADAIRAAQEAWGTVKMRRQQEEARKREAERVEQERIAAEQAEAAQAAVDSGHAPPDPIPQPKVEEPPRVAPQTSFKGGSGRAAHEKKVTVITEVTDWSALYLYFVQDQVVRDFILKRAQMFLKSTGEIPPGCATDVAAKVA